MKKIDIYRFFFGLLFISLILSPTLLAVTIYVDVDAVGLNTGTSWTNAYTSFQSGLDAASSDDEIWVAEGTYHPTVEHGGVGQAYRSFQLKNHVAIYGGFDPTTGDDTFGERDWDTHVTVLSGVQAGDNCYHVFFHTSDLNLGPTAYLDGFTITGGYAAGGSSLTAAGGGMYNDECSPTIKNCTFTGNYASMNGGAVYNVNFAEPYFENCLFINNSAEAGGGVYDFWGTNAIFNRCTFQDNIAETHAGGMMDYEDCSAFLRDCVFIHNVVTETNGKGGGIYCGWDSTPVIINGLFYYNMAYNGGAAHHMSGCDAEFVNCTIANNLAYNLGGGLYNYNSDPHLVNSIVFHNNPNMNQIYNEDVGSVPVVSYSDIQGGYAGNQNINIVPAFKHRPDFVDYTTAVGTTTTIVVSLGAVYAIDDAIEIENDNVKRVISGIKSNTITFSPALSAASAAGMLISNWGTNTTLLSVKENYQLDNGSPCIDKGYNSAGRLPSMDLLGRPRILDGDDNGTSIVDMGAYEVSIGIIYVDHDAKGNNNGTSWSDAYIDLQDALDDASSGDEIWVAEGTYMPSNRVIITDLRSAAFRLKNGVAIYGGFDPSLNCTLWSQRDWVNLKTILSGDVGMMVVETDNAYHVFYHPSSLALDRTAVLDGFIITKARTENGIAAPHNAGGGMYNNGCSPSIINCTFTDNDADEYGGGMANYSSSPLVENCTFQYNDTAYGGAVYNQGGAPEFISCLFGSDGSDTRINEASMGGAIYNDNSSASFTACEIRNNYASCNGGGFYNDGGSPVITDCIIRANRAEGSIDECRGGGGMFCHNSNAVITDTQFLNCFVYYYGGGILIEGTAVPTLTGCIIDTCLADEGGGIYFDGSAAVLENCVISNCQTYFGDNGAGVYCNPGSTPMFNNCTIEDNVAESNGAGLYLDNAAPTLTNCLIQRNKATQKGGGMTSVNYSAPTVTGCTFSQNTAMTYGYWAGGVHSVFYEAGTYTNCTFTGNTADFGAGFTAEQFSSPTLVSCTFENNTSDFAGSGLFCHEDSSPVVVNCLFHHNISAGSGEISGAIFVSNGAQLDLINCTIVENTSDGWGGGICGSNGTATITSCILWDNVPTQIAGPFPGDPFNVNYCNVQGGWSGTHNKNVNPLFVDSTTYNYRLQEISECIDTGKNATVPAWATMDRDGLPRKVDGNCDGNIQVDIGAYEFSYSYFGSFDNDCDIDLADFEILSSAWLAEPADAAWNRVCDISEPADDIIDILDLQIFADNWLLGR